MNRFNIKNKELIQYRNSSIFTDIETILINSDYILSNDDYSNLVKFGIENCKKNRKVITSSIHSIFNKIDNNKKHEA